MMQVEQTKRGFNRIDFTDRDGVECNLQESCLESIWFGCNDAKPELLIPGQGWTEIDMPDEYIVNTRMHLTQEQVKELLPHLIKFADTGEI